VYLYDLPGWALGGRAGGGQGSDGVADGDWLGGGPEEEAGQPSLEDRMRRRAAAPRLRAQVQLNPGGRDGPGQPPQCTSAMHLRASR
jgi:hypothetical protein